ncbi:MAG: hypothetical protein P4L22_00520, partial [Candidatus Babeliales bacterium]|nr:hypothetical protein [Candidatus Babeliales bacterium]
MKLKNIILLLLLLTFNLINCAPANIFISEKRIDELASWFATGMAEYEKDYKKTVAAQQANVNLNSYTQTEANMKLLVDIYNYEMKPQNSNSTSSVKVLTHSAALKNNTPPKVDTLNDLRNNENALVNWVSTIYQHKWGKSLQNFKPLIGNILKREKENINDYVLYHGHSLSLSLNFDLFRELDSFIFYAPKIFNSENITNLKPKESVIRYLKNSNPKYTNADEFVKAWQPSWNDQTPELSELLLSTNLGLFQNMVNSGSNTFYYFVTSLSLLGANHTTWIDKVFKDWNFEPKYKKDLNDLYKNFIKSDSGNLLQIFIPKPLLNKLVYTSQVGGIPYNQYGNSLNTLISNPNATTADVFDFYRKAKFPQGSALYKFNSLQFRILLIPEFFDFNNDIKIFKYTNSELDGEFGPDYKKGLRNIVAKMMINYILKNQSEILKGTDLQLKQIFYEIAQWADLSAAQQAQIDKDKADNIQKIKDKEKTDKAKEAKEKIQKEKITKQYDLGWKYYNNAEYLKAIQPLKETAEQNLDIPKKSDACWALACIYGYGLGVSKDLNLAKQYATTAVNSGATWTQTILDYINTEIKNEKAAKEKIAKDKAAQDKAAKDKAAAAAKAKALLAAKAKQFKTTSDLLTQQANIIWQFKVAQASKKALLVKKLAPQVNKLKKDLVTVPVNIKNAQGQTPLMLDPRRAPIVYGLEKKKAKVTVNAKDAKGKT